MSVNVAGGGLSFDATIDGSQFQAQLNRMELQVNRFTRDVQKNGSELDSLASKAALFTASYFSITAATGFVRSIVEVRGAFQQIEVAYRTMLKSKEAGDKLFRQTVALAAKTPFNLQDVAQGSKQLLAYGFGANEVTDTLTTLGNVASGVGAPLNDIVYLYGTLRTQGRAYQKDITQFTGRGIPIVAELAKQFGVTESKVQALVEAGKVGFPEVKKAFDNLTGSSGIFFNLMQEQSKTLTGQISNLEDAWSRMLNALGQSQEGIFADGIGAATALIDNYQEVIKVIEVLIATYGTYRAALIVSTLATSGMTAVELLHYSALVIAEKAQKLLNITTLANPYVAVAAALGALIAAVIVYGDELSGASQAQSVLNDISKQTAIQFEVEKNKLAQLLVVANNESLSKERRLKAIREINRISPEQLGNLTLENIKTMEAKNSIDAYIKSLEKQIKLKIAQQELENLIKEQQEGPGFGDTAIAFIKNFGNQTGAAIDAATSFAGKNFEAQKKVKQLISDLIDQEDVAKDIPVSKRTLAAIEEDIKAKKETQSLVTSKKEYADIQREINKLEAEKASITGIVSKTEKKQNEERKQALKNILDAETEAFNKGLTRNQEEIKAAKDKTNELRKEAKSQGLGAGSLIRIDRIEQKLTGDISYRQETEKLKASIEAQKLIFAEFENFKIQVGEEKATERFKNELSIANKLQDDAAKELAGLLTISSIGSLTGPQQERFNILLKNLEAENKAKKDIEDKALIESFNAAKDHNQRLIDIEIEYQEKIKGFNGKATDAQIVELQRQRTEKIQVENASALDSETNWSNMFASFERMSKESVAKYLVSVRKKVEADYKSGELSQAEYISRTNQINDAYTRFGNNNVFGRVGPAIKKWTDAVKEFGKGSIEAKSAFKEMAGTVSEAADAAGAIFGDVVNTLEGLGIGGDKYTQATLKSVEGLIGGVGTLAKGIATGNPVDIIKGSIQLLTNAIDLFNTKDKKLERQIDGYKANLESLGKAFKQLEKDIANSVGESVYTDSAAAIRNLQNQQKQLSLALAAEKAKKKSDPAKIKEYEDALAAIPDQIEAINKAVAESLIQTTFKDFSNDLADAFSEAFAAGEDAAGRFDDAFDQVIKNAIKNSLKLKLIEPIVKQFTDALTEYAKGNGNSIAGFDFDKYRELLKNAGAQYTDALAGFGDFFKNEANDASNSKNTLSGAIKGITTEQADLLAGQFGGLRITQLLTNELLKMQTEVQNQQLMLQRIISNSLINIEAHTLRTANNTDRLFNVEIYLKSMSEKFDSVANALRAGGKI